MTLHPDIFLYILELLRENKPALERCSRVSHDWLSPSRSHLFSSIKVYGYDPRTDKSDVDTFSAFLDLTPSVCSYIRELEIQAGKPVPAIRDANESNDSDSEDSDSELDSDTDSEDSAGFEPPPLILSSCFTLVSKLPQLSKLKISKAKIEAKRYYNTPFDPPKSLPSVVHLELSNLETRYGSPLICWDIVRPFNNLRTLRMFHIGGLCDLEERTGVQASPIPFPELPLQHLSIRTADSGAVLQYLLDTKCLQSVTFLEVDTGWRQTSLALNNVLKRYGSQILDIAISAFGFQDPRHTITMNLCTNLRSIEFVVSTSVHRPRLINDSTWDIVVNDLQAIPSALRRVTINAELYGDNAVVTKEIGRCVNWDRLEGVLASHKALESVVVEFSNTTKMNNAVPLSGQDLADANALVETRLVGVRERGILRLTTE